MIETTLEVTAAVRQQLIHKGVNSIRLGVKGGGCAGMEYIFEEDVETQSDYVLDHGDFKFLIDTSHMPFIESMKLEKDQSG